MGLDQPAAIAKEVALGLKTLASGETAAGLGRFKSGVGRHGRFEPDVG